MNEHVSVIITFSQLCSGELLGALAIGEVNVGSDIMSMQCHAEKKGK